MKIRDFQLDTPIIPAPLAGYTDRAYRTILREFGSHITFPGLVPALGLIRNPEAILADIKISEEPRPLGVQLFGNAPGVMADAAQLLEELKVTVIDINMGCPMRKIVNVGGGAALMREPRLAGDIVRAIRKRITLPLTVKIRSGWGEFSLNYLEFSEKMIDSGADAVCLHPRTRRQSFSGNADWHKIAELKKSVPVPVIGNGDVRTPRDALRMMRETGCDAVMVGRGIIGNPWLIQQANRLYCGEQVMDDSPSFEERVSVILRHYELMVQYKGERKGIIEMRKHVIRYIAGMRGARSLRQELMAFTTLEEIKAFFHLLREEYRHD